MENWASILGDENGLKEYIKQQGHGAVCTRWGHAYFKKIDRVFTVGDMTDVSDVDTWVYDSSRDVERPIREIQGGTTVELSLGIQTKLIAKILVEGQYDTLLLNGEESLVVDGTSSITISR